MDYSRRLLLATASGFAFLASKAPSLAQSVDAEKLLKPPGHGEMVLGAENAPVTIVEFASASCPHCAAFHADVFVPLERDYIAKGKVRFIFREYPHNDMGLAAFMVARSVPKDKYFAILDVIFRTQNTWLQNPLHELRDIAKQSGLTETQFDALLKNSELAGAIRAVVHAASELGVNGVPALFINSERYSGLNNYEDVKAEVDKLIT